MWSASDYCFSLAASHQSASSSLPYRVKCSGMTGVVIWCFIKIKKLSVNCPKIPKQLIRL